MVVKLTFAGWQLVEKQTNHDFSCRDHQNGGFKREMGQTICALQ
jgi:hypothetical protein